MKDIGGYFELELNKKEEYHKEAIRLNTGRNALEYILLVNSYSKVYLPFFTCDVLLEPLNKHKISYEFYNIDEQFEPLFDYSRIKSSEAFLYTNYFGLKDSFIIQIAAFCKNLIIDCAQSFFSKPIQGIDTFYSARKFFGVPDGAYLYSDTKLDISFEKDVSFDRFSHLLKRLDCSAEEGYKDFVHNDSSLSNQDIKEMSALSERLLSSIDYTIYANRRIRNFNFLHEELEKKNKLKIGLSGNVPMVYPYWTDDKTVRQKLLNNKIYTPTYWKNVNQLCKPESLEYRLADEIVYLPIDQRYDEIDLVNIIKIINNEY
jgi:hypothetical protein